MIDLLRMTEGQPADYLSDGCYDGEDHDDLMAKALWQRIESYIAHRWKTRPVEFIVEGEGEWSIPITPVDVDTIERWHDGRWITAAINPGPLGYVFDSGTYRIKGTAGHTDDPPNAVQAAHRRLYRYLNDEYSVSMAASGMSMSFGSDLSYRIDRPSAWIARAMQYSGAADLLRPYR